jgi:hypothetical protein
VPSLLVFVIMSFVSPDIGKKEALVIETEHASLGLTQNPSLDLVEKESTSQLDPAASFLEKHRDLDVSDLDINKLRHKIDFRVRRPENHERSELMSPLDNTSDVCLLHSCFS